MNIKDNLKLMIAFIFMETFQWIKSYFPLIVNTIGNAFFASTEQVKVAQLFNTNIAAITAETHGPLPICAHIRCVVSARCEQVLIVQFIPYREIQWYTCFICIFILIAILLNSHSPAICNKPPSLQKKKNYGIYLWKGSISIVIQQHTGQYR